VSRATINESTQLAPPPPLLLLLLLLLAGRGARVAGSAAAAAAAVRTGVKRCEPRPARGEAARGLLAARWPPVPVAAAVNAAAVKAAAAAAGSGPLQAPLRASQVATSRLPSITATARGVDR